MAEGAGSTHVHDVVVAGGGPAGLYAAMLLARKGRDVALFEEHRSPGEPVHCTGVLASEAYDDLEIPRHAILNTLKHVRFVAPDGQAVEYTTPEIEALVIDRRVFDHHLHAAAVAAGVRISAGARVLDAKTTPTGVSLTLSDGRTVEGRACVLACGASYVLQRRLGLGMPRVFLQSAQVECEAAPFDQVEVHFGRDAAPSGFAWAVPVRRGTSAFARIGLMCEGSAARQFERFVSGIGRRLSLPPARGERLEPRVKMLPLAPLRKTYSNRLLAVGDAAGLVKATTGGGIYYSLVSAALAAGVLDDALGRDALAERDLQPYEAAWRKRLGAELDAQLSLRLLANRMNDSDINLLFDLARTDGIMPIVRKTARFNQHRDLILSLLKHPPVRRILLRHLAGRRQPAAV